MRSYNTSEAWRVWRTGACPRWGELSLGAASSSRSVWRVDKIGAAADNTEMRLGIATKRGGRERRCGRLP